MHLVLTPHIIPLLLTAVTSIILAVYAFQHRATLTSLQFMILMLAFAEWSTTYALEIVSIDMLTKITWAKIQYLGIVSFPVIWLTLSLEHTGHKTWLTRRNIITLAIVPLITLLLVWTNGFHGLIWQKVELMVIPPLRLLNVAYGGWFWVHTIYSYSLVLLGFLFLVANWRNEIASLYRFQTIPLLVGIFILPILGNAVYLAGFTSIDLTPFSFLLSSIVLGHYIIRFRLFEIAPHAHQAIINSMDQPILAVDEHDNLIYLNVAAQTVFQRPFPVTTGHPLTQIHPKLVSKPATSPYEIYFELDGEEQYYEVHSSSFYNNRSKGNGRLLTFHNVTDRRQQDYVRKDMTQTLVHDLRVPISNTLFGLEMLLSTLENNQTSKSKELIKMIFSSTTKTLDLVNQILDISRLESGVISLDVAEINLLDVVNDVIMTTSPQAFEKGVTIQVGTFSYLPKPWGDAALIERVIQNLLDNSIRFSPENGVIFIEASLEEEPFPHLVIRVSDNGVGVPTKLQERIFDKFVTYEFDQRGTGLGLSFCRTVLTAHDESIWVESKLGEGATFAFTLPISPERIPMPSNMDQTA